MNTSLSQPTRHSPTQGVNPFARALAEARGGQSSEDQFASPKNKDYQNSPLNLDEQQLQQAEKLKRERMRQQRYREINPIEAHDVYNAKQEQVKKEIDSIRYELRMLSKEVVAFEKDVDLTLMSNVAEPGQTGTYFITFFQQLRAWIQLLRAKVHSARTWATTFTSKKRKSKNTPGMEIGGKNYEQTATIFDMMHHERSTAYSGS